MVLPVVTFAVIIFAVFRFANTADRTKSLDRILTLTASACTFPATVNRSMMLVVPIETFAMI